MLQNTDIIMADFSICVEDAMDSDFVYFDPPYFPVSSAAKFAEYTKESFGKEDFYRPLKTCRTLDDRNVRFLMSNSYTDIV